MILKIPGVRADNSCDDEMTHSHANTPGDQDRPSTDIVHPKDGRNGKDKFKNSSNPSC